MLPRSTDPNAIVTFLRETEGTPRVIFCTYHSVDRVGAALREVGAAADLLVCDEAHRCTGRTSKRFARPLFDEFLPARRRLFLTATPKLIGEKSATQTAPSSRPDRWTTRAFWGGMFTG